MKKKPKLTLRQCQHMLESAAKRMIKAKAGGTWGNKKWESAAKEFELLWPLWIEKIPKKEINSRIHTLAIKSRELDVDNPRPESQWIDSKSETLSVIDPKNPSRRLIY